MAGGGEVAERKVKSLLKFGAKVVVVAPTFTKLLSRIKAARLVRRGYRTGDLKGAALVIAATDDPKINRRISKDARLRNILVNVVDAPSLCSFIVPSVIKRGPLVVAISTSGRAPALAKALRLKLQKVITPGLGKLAQELGKARRQRLGTASVGA